tara:strand:+ start:7903 stop:8613 length:711 start_codon:yes stop_codon:yes gene_type:complete
MTSTLNVPFYISTNNKHLHVLQVFIDLFNKHLPQQELHILGYDHPKYNLPANCKFISMGEQGTVDEWSTDLRKFFLSCNESFFIYGTEDAFIYKDVSVEFVNHLIDFAKTNESVGRVDLRDAPLQHYSTSLKESCVDDWGSWDLLKLDKPESDCAITCQFSVWNKEYFLRYLQDGLSPWAFEGTAKQACHDKDFDVYLVDKNYPIRIAEGYTQGTWTNKNTWYHLLDDETREQALK